MSIDYTRPVKVDGRTGFVATGVEHVPNVRGPIREFLGMMAPAAVAMIIVAALVLLTACGPDKAQTPEPAPMAAPTAPVAMAKPVKHNHLSDCKLFPAKYRPLCLKVYRQHPYGLYIAGDMGGMWSAPAGPVLVHEITHQGLTKGEMIDYLKGEALNYREAVTAVPLNMDKLKAKCGYDGRYVVQFRDEDGKPGGRKITEIRTECP